MGEGGSEQVRQELSEKPLFDVERFLSSLRLEPRENVKELLTDGTF